MFADQLGGVDTQHTRRVQETVLDSLPIPVQRRRDGDATGGSLQTVEDVLTDYHESYSRCANGFLVTSVNYTETLPELRQISGADGGWHVAGNNLIGYFLGQLIEYLCKHFLIEFYAIVCLVLADVEILGVWIEGIGVQIQNGPWIYLVDPVILRGLVGGFLARLTTITMRNVKILTRRSRSWRWHTCYRRRHGPWDSGAQLRITMWLLPAREWCGSSLGSS